MSVSICLNMIVRNESTIIRRLLNSVIPLIDTYCICDTGSTDNTKEVIREYFSTKGISGEIFDCSFQNFGYNRTIALQRARHKATYILLMDADMILEITDKFQKSSLTADAYRIEQGRVDFTYYNIRLVRGTLNVTSKGVTHEFYDLPKGSSLCNLKTLYIKDIGDGGCKDNKFSRDIRLLSEGIIKEPNNARYYFYLANSYYNIDRIDEAVDMYKKRVEMGGWVEEVWYSYYRIGLCYSKKKNYEKAISFWLEGYNYYPKRSENIYEIVKCYRIAKKWNLAKLFIDIGKNIPLPKDNLLFIHHDVYNYLFDYEWSIVAFYISPRVDITECYKKLLGMNTTLNRQHLLNNLKYYPIAIKEGDQV